MNTHPSRHAGDLDRHHHEFQPGLRHGGPVHAAGRLRRHAHDGQAERSGTLLQGEAQACSKAAGRDPAQNDSPARTHATSLLLRSCVDEAVRSRLILRVRVWGHLSCCAPILRLALGHACLVDAPVTCGRPRTTFRPCSSRPPTVCTGTRDPASRKWSTRCHPLLRCFRRWAPCKRKWACDDAYEPCVLFSVCALPFASACTSPQTSRFCVHLGSRPPVLLVICNLTGPGSMNDRMRPCTHQPRCLCLAGRHRHQPDDLRGQHGVRPELHVDGDRLRGGPFHRRRHADWVRAPLCTASDPTAPSPTGAYPACMRPGTARDRASPRGVVAGDVSVRSL